MEVVLLSGISGFAGLLIGVCVSWGWGFFGNMAIFIHPTDLFQSLAVLGAVSLVTGLAPALWALRLDPIQLLRLHR